MKLYKVTSGKTVSMKKSRNEKKKTMYKGFNENMQCKGFQFEVGKDYEEERAELCRTGFHACINPFDVWDHYSVVNSRFAEVELDEISEESLNLDSKRCGKKIKINAEIAVSGIVKAAVETILDDTKDSSGDFAQIGSSGDLANIGNSGDYAHICSSGNAAQIGSSGNAAQIGSSGNNAKTASCGNYAKIGSSGDSAKIGSSGNAAQIDSSGDFAQIGSSGNAAQIGSSGKYAQICSNGRHAQIGSSGDFAQIGSSGDDAVIAAIGVNNMVKAKKGSWITLAEYDENHKPVCVKTEQVDGEKIKADTDYILVGGVFKEATK